MTAIPAAYPPPGQLVPVAGRLLHIHPAGRGSPTVVLEAGGGSWSMDWRSVQEEVASFTQVCSYDRAGFGWSDPGPRPRNAESMAEELAALLAASGQRGPYILVGASFGGHVVRLFAARRPRDAAGVILLDARHDAIDERMPASWRKLQRTAAGAQQVMLVLARTRLLKLAARLGGARSTPPAAQRLPPDLRDMYLAVGFQPKYFETNLAELEAIGQSDLAVRNAPRLGDIPLTVVRHGIPDIFATLPAKDAVQAETTWVGLQEDLARLSTRSRLLIAERSGHAIQLDAPQLVVDLIREQVAQARRADPRPA